ncbi:MAG: hypothetical protein HY648_12125 [Acidobacteria bacterium]|nr:hypothetical protein [Acidobacteriota bacterium]
MADQLLSTHYSTPHDHFSTQRSGRTHFQLRSSLNRADQRRIARHHETTELRESKARHFPVQRTR